MKAVISSTTDQKYFFFIPIATWCWNKLGIDVICFLPTNQGPMGGRELQLLDECIDNNNLKLRLEFFNCPEYKEATYAQCARLFASSLDYLNPNEFLTVGDVDMLLFKLPPTDYEKFCIYGMDLVPENQFPMCYITSTISSWRYAFRTWNRGFQHCLDELVGSIECTNFRGNQWSLDQSEAFRKITPENPTHISRARPYTQFASHRVDRTDTNWKSYLGPDLFDAHLWRPGYTDENFANIMELLTTQYPNDNFQWLIDYRIAYISLL